MVFRFGNNDRINQRSRDHNVTRINRAGLGNPFDLYNDFAAGIVCRQRLNVKFKTNRFFFDADIPKFIRGGAPDNCHVNRKCFIPKILLTFEFNQLYHFALGTLIQPAAGFSRVRKSLESNVRDDAGLLAPYRTIQVYHNSLRNRIGFALLGVNHFDHVRLEVKVPGDDFGDQPFFTPTVEPPVGLSVILGRAVSQS